MLLFKGLIQRPLKPASIGLGLTFHPIAVSYTAIWETEINCGVSGFLGSVPSSGRVCGSSG